MNRFNILLASYLLLLLIPAPQLSAKALGEGLPASMFPPLGAEIEVRAGGFPLAQHDTVPSTLDGTDFGLVLTCGGSVTHDVVIENSGSDTLYLYNVTLSGPGIADWSASPLQPYLLPGGRDTLQVSFDPTTVGLSTVTVTILNSDVDEGMFDFRVQGWGAADVVPPVAQCQPVLLYLGTNGSASLSPAQMNNGSTDNCGISSMEVSKTIFTCQDYAPTQVTLTVQDAAGNLSSCTAAVSVDDTTPPVARCRASVVGNQDNQGLLWLNAMMVDSFSYDNCGLPINSRWLSHSYVGCNGLVNPTSTVVTLWVRDNFFNMSSCTTTVYSYDYQAPSIYMCPRDTVYVNTTNSVNYSACNSLSLFPPDVFEACTMISCNPSNTVFTCSNLGVHQIWTTFSDGWGNASSCMVEVTVLSNNAPTALCQNATVSLGGNGTVSLSPSVINNGSFSPCGGSIQLSVSPATFSCNQLGVRNVVLTATAPGGGVSTCSASVTVQDLQAPVPTCQPVTVNLGPQGTATLSPSLMLAGSIENCGVVSQVASQTLFTCADLAGTPVTVTVADASGNVGTCTSVVTAVPMPLSLQVQAPLQACGYHISCDGASDGTAMAVATWNGCGTQMTYLWSTGDTTAQVTGLAAGTYAVTISDGVGQPVSQSITLTSPPPLQLQVVPPSPVCLGDSIGMLSASATGGNACQAYSYLWSTGDTAALLAGQPAGNYAVTVTDAGGCQTSLQTQINSLALPVPVVSLVGSVLQLQGSFASLQWYQGGTPIPGAIFPSLVLTASGSYHVVVTDTNGCSASSPAFPFTYVGVEGLAPWAGVSLYPNPSTGRFSIRMENAAAGAATVELVELSGRVLRTWQVAALRSGDVFDTGAAAAGTYLVVLTGEDGARRVFRLVRQ